VGSSAKKYQRAKKGLSRAVVAGSLALHKGMLEPGCDEEAVRAKADTIIKEGIKNVIRRQTLRYVLEAVSAVISTCQERKHLDVVSDKGRKGKVALYYDPLINMETEWLYKEVKT